MFLATTALDQFWDKSKKILFLGPWCLLYQKRSEWSNLDFQVMESPWTDREQFYKAAGYTDAIYEQSLRVLTDYLNAIHKTKYSERYWRILIGPWLIRYIHSLYDRYCHIHSAFQNHDPLETWCLSSECFITPQNISHFIDLYVDDFYNLQLYSQITGFMGYNFLTIQFHHQMSSGKNDIKNRKVISKIEETVKCQTKRFCATINDLIARRKKILLCGLYIPRSVVWKIVYASQFQAWPFEKQWDRYWPNLEYLDYKAREGLGDLPASDNFSKLLVQTLPINFPILYLEGYQKSREQVLQEWKKFPKVLMSSVSWYFNEYFKLLAAEACERGTLLLACQHGGGYGSGKIPVETHEIKVSDMFYSWGWRSNEYSNKVKPLPTPRLSGSLLRSLSSNRLARETILFVTTNHPRYLYYFYSCPVGLQFEDYCEMRKDFIHSLSPEYRNMLLFRLYPTDYGRFQKDRLREEFPYLRFDNHRLSLAKQLLKVRIVVIDHPMTSFLETLSYNFPCILFWNPNYWEMRNEAVRFFEGLRQAGILFDSAESAAVKLMEVYDDPLRWWSSAEVQSARKTFITRFALGSNEWLKAWINELRVASNKKCAIS